MEYLIILLLILYYVFIHDIRCREKNTRKHKVIVFFALSLIAGLRSRMAPDTITFEYEFNNIYPTLYSIKYSDLFDSRYPPIWFLLNSLFYTISNYYVFQLFCAFLTNYIVFRVIDNLSDKFFTVILFYYIYNFCYFNMDVMREFCAVSMELLAFVYVIEGKNKKSLMFAVIAPLIHSFSFFFSFLLLLMQIKPKRTTLMFVGVIGIIFVLSFSRILPLLLVYIPGISASFLFYAFMDIEQMSFAGWLTRVISPIIIFYIIKQANNRGEIILHNSANCSTNNNDLVLLCISYFFIVLLRWSVPYVERLFNYFAIINYIVFAYGFYKFVGRSRSHSYKFWALLLISIVFYIPTGKEMLSKNDAGVENLFRYYPYSSIIYERPCMERELIIHDEQRVY